MAEFPLPLASFTSDGFVASARELVPRGFGKARLLYEMLFETGRFAPEELGLSAEACAAYRAHYEYQALRVVRVASEDGPLGPTHKAVLRTHDDLEVECVLIPMGRDRHTLCISSQVGCKMGCGFCETARLGLLRHLTTAEIIGQVLTVKHELSWPIRNIVFMGMGEALDNYDNVVKAIRVMNDQGGLALAQERLTLCTVGRADGIRKLRAEGFKRLNLSVSLNAANDDLRNRLMPVNRTTPLAVLQEELRQYTPRRNFALGVNYCLMPGINDSREDAAAVASFCAPIARVLVNVIGYNPGNAPLTRAPSEDEVDQFMEWLREDGVAVRKRITKGRDLMAACGQLGNVELRRKRDEERATR